MKIELEEIVECRCQLCNKLAFVCRRGIWDRAAKRGLEPVCANCSELVEFDEDFEAECEGELV